MKSRRRLPTKPHCRVVVPFGLLQDESMRTVRFKTDHGATNLLTRDGPKVCELSQDQGRTSSSREKSGTRLPSAPLDAEDGGPRPNRK